MSVPKGAPLPAMEVNMSLWAGNFVKLKQGVPNYWGIDPERIYVVQETKWGVGNQNMLLLRDNNGKIRRYYEHLFEEVKMPLTDAEITDQSNKNLRDAWLKDSSEASKYAYKQLKERDEEWRKTQKFLKGVKVRFIRGKEADKYKGRVFVLASNQDFQGLFSAVVRLSGLYGYWDTKNLEVEE